MKCTHNDCFTCPYNDCISDVEVTPEGKKKGRKTLPLEEKKRRRKIYNATYNKKHQQDNHERYIRKTEGIVKRRYKTKISEMDKGANNDK